MSRLLYFPLASPPEHVALQAALYWDELLTVTPSGYEFSSPLLLAMAERGALTRVDVDALFMEPGSLDSLVQELAAVLDELPPNDLVPDTREPLSGSNRLYHGKFPGLIQNKLLERGVAIPVSESEYQLAPATLNLLMSVTAPRFAAMLNVNPASPVALLADSRQSFAQAFAPLQSSRQTAWRLEIGDELPIPLPGTDPGLLLDFRDQHREERDRLVIALSTLASSLSVGEEVDIEAMVKSMRAAKDDLVRAGRSANVGWGKRAIAVTATTGIVGAAAAIGPEVGASVAFLASLGIEAARTKMRQAEPTFAYLHSIEKTFGTL